MAGWPRDRAASRLGHLSGGVRQGGRLVTPHSLKPLCLPPTQHSCCCVLLSCTPPPPGPCRPVSKDHVTLRSEQRPRPQLRPVAGVAEAPAVPSSVCRPCCHPGSLLPAIRSRPLLPPMRHAVWDGLALTAAPASALCPPGPQASHSQNESLPTRARTPSQEPSARQSQGSGPLQGHLPFLPSPCTCPAICTCPVHPSGSP